MTHYLKKWRCGICNEPQESIDKLNGHSFCQKCMKIDLNVDIIESEARAELRSQLQKAAMLGFLSGFRSGMRFADSE